jgi:hypothetical protein
MTEFEPIRFARLPASEKKVWRRPKSFEFANHISQVPLADSELLLTSHHLPIAIDYVDDRLQVIAIIKSQFLRSAAVGANGQWRRGYLPIALRCLPFRAVAGSSETERLEVALNLDEAEGTALPIFAADGSLAPEVSQIGKLLERLERGKRQLQKAAETLLIAGVLSPFQLARLPDTVVSSRALTVDRNKLSALSNSRAAHLAKDSFLPIDVASACIFSQRLMSNLVSVVTEPDQIPGQEPCAEARDSVLAGLRSNVRIDESQLFSFELFEEMSRRYEKQD